MRFEKTNEMLVNCCALSSRRLEKAKKELIFNRQLILEMKSDLESIFRRIRALKQNYISKYPQIYQHFGRRSAFICSGLLLL
ncbi:unnamed protein product [Gongylonema pulchrum]|uniref:KxDL domain-containing protein n=1 Tax=Gongylonema pulchrum TaxID=637853 RepID=A0A183DV70_9BILA|nr:unnamed protein product [Gongylonema pulchrum]